MRLWEGAPVVLPGYIDQFAVGMVLAVALETWGRTEAEAPGRC